PHPQKLRYVLAGGADANRMVRPGLSPLMAAAAHAGGSDKASEMTRILLDAGADVGFVGPEGSALHAAASLGRGEVVSALIDAGADLDARDKDGCSPVEVCTDELVLLLLTQAADDADEADEADDIDIDVGLVYSGEQEKQEARRSDAGRAAAAAKSAAISGAKSAAARAGAVAAAAGVGAAKKKQT
ncbi:unnamed protein product, partial [Laminaria digitata]